MWNERLCQLKELVEYLYNVQVSNASGDGLGPFYQHGLTLIPPWKNYNIHYKVLDEISYPFPKFNGTTV